MSKWSSHSIQTCSPIGIPMSSPPTIQAKLTPLFLSHPTSNVPATIVSLHVISVLDLKTDNINGSSIKTCAHLLREHQNHNQLLNNCRQENVGSHQKKIPHVQGQRRSCNKTVGGVQPHLKSSLIPPATGACKRNPVAPGPGKEP